MDQLRGRSGRSNFPAKDELEKIDLPPNLEDLKDRITPVQLDRLRAVLEANATVLAKNKADVGRCRLMEHRMHFHTLRVRAGWPNGKPKKPTKK